MRATALNPHVERQIGPLSAKFGPVNARRATFGGDHVRFYVPLPTGWNRRRIHVEVFIPECFPICNPADFFVLDDGLRLDHGGLPRHCDPLSSPGKLRFLLRPDHWNGNLDTLTTYAHLVRLRFQREHRDS